MITVYIDTISVLKFLFIICLLYVFEDFFLILSFLLHTFIIGLLEYIQKNISLILIMLITIYVCMFIGKELPY